LVAKSIISVLQNIWVVASFAALFGWNKELKAIRIKELQPKTSAAVMKNTYMVDPSNPAIVKQSRSKTPSKATSLFVNSNELTTKKVTNLINVTECSHKYKSPIKFEQHRRIQFIIHKKFPWQPSSACWSSSADSWWLLHI
jgi:hypothetical protein